MSELLTDHISFSQLTQAEGCPYAFFLLKAIGVKPAVNAFAQAGTLAHQILAMWARGQAVIKDLPGMWTQMFPETVTAPFPAYLASKGYANKLFSSVLTYFEEFTGFPGYEILDAEREFQSSIAGERFVGIIDLILRNKETGGLLVVDHKSCSLSSFRKDKEQMYRQLLLYSKHCADIYGVFPETLRFNLFKENLIDERPFDSKSYVDARVWAETIIDQMKTKEITDWLETRPDFFKCTNLCSCRNECIFGKPENHKRKDEISGTKSIPAVA